MKNCACGCEDCAALRRRLAFQLKRWERESRCVNAPNYIRTYAEVRADVLRHVLTGDQQKGLR